MSVLEELKSSARESLDAKVSALKQLLAEAWTKKADNEAQIRETLLSFLSQVRTPYDATVGQAKETDSVNEGAALWSETHDFYATRVRLWNKLRANWRSDRVHLHFVFIANALKRLEEDALGQYEFYARMAGESKSSPAASSLKIHAVFEPCEEGGYHAFVPEIAGVHSEGETIKEAAKNLVDALGLFLLDELEDKLLNVDSADRIEIKLSFSPSQSETTRA